MIIDLKRNNFQLLKNFRLGNVKVFLVFKEKYLIVADYTGKVVIINIHNMEKVATQNIGHEQSFLFGYLI